MCLRISRGWNFALPFVCICWLYLLLLVHSTLNWFSSPKDFELVLINAIICTYGKKIRGHLIFAKISESKLLLFLSSSSSSFSFPEYLEKIHAQPVVLSWSTKLCPESYLSCLMSIFIVLHTLLGCKFWSCPHGLQYFDNVYCTAGYTWSSSSVCPWKRTPGDAWHT